jgi:ACS family glucarate transporter-like MFS transporter
MAVASGFWSLLVVRVALGIGQAAIFPASIHVIASWFTDKQRATAVALFSTGSRFGLIVLPVTGAWLISNWGWRVFFLVVGLVPMIWLLAWHKFFLRFPEQISLNNSPAVVRTTSKQDQSPSMRGLLRNRNVWGICLGYFAYDYVWYLYIAWLPGYLMLERGYALAQTGVYAAFPMAAMSIVIPSAGLASDWLVRRGYSEIAVRKTFLCLGLLLACAMVPAGLVADPFVSVLWLTFALAGLGLAAPNTWALTMKLSPRDSVGLLSGVQNFAGNIGGVLAPLITGYIAHITGSFALALGFASIVSFCGVLAYLFLCHAPDANPHSAIRCPSVPSSVPGT